MARSKRSFGGIRKLPSRRWQANFTAPDGRIYNAPTTFETKQDAEAWLVDRRREIARNVWAPPTEHGQRPLTFGEYSSAWLLDRILKPRTRAHYASILDSRLLPTFGQMPLTAITPASVARWHWCKTETESVFPSVKNGSISKSMLRSARAG